MTTNNTEKKTRVPRTYDSIKAGALSLTLEERGQLRDELHSSITKEAAELKAKSDAATKLANGSGS